MDTGGLAHMTYNNNFPSENTLNVPGTGFASRGKGGHIKRLSFAPPPKINAIHEEDVDNATNLRTNRGQLLAGLRTASRHQGVPASAPHNQAHFRYPSDAHGYSSHGNVRLGQDVPHTAVGAAFPSHVHNLPYGNNQQNYNFPEQVLAPPQFADSSNEHMDPSLYNDLMATNYYLVQRQQQLQQQLLSVTAAAQQLQGMNLNGTAQYPASPVSPQLSTYDRQVQNGMQPVVQPVQNQPGLYTVYNPMTGQSSYYFDQAAQNQLSSSPPYSGASPDVEIASVYRQDGFTTQVKNMAGRANNSPSPPKKTPSPPQDIAPLPPPSATAFKPGHRKAASTGFAALSKPTVENALKSPNPRATTFAQTPTTGTFGPGLGRAGEHPTRQPRGPPPLEELIASPTSKHEGSKNFAALQRRRALNSLVRAGNERRSGRGTNGSGTPCSESEINFTITSEVDPDTSPNGAYALASGLRGSASGAIGSEWKELKERSRERGSRERGLAPRHLAGPSYGGNDSSFGGRRE